MARSRPVSAVDIVASALVRVAPSPVARVIDQARLDAHSITQSLLGERPPSFSTKQHPPLRAPALASVDPIFHALPRMLRPSYETLRGDLDMIGRGLLGDRPPAVIAKRAVARPAMEVRPRPVTVTEVIVETSDARTFVLAEASGAPLAFRPGQFLTLHVAIDGRVHKRAYSLSRAPARGAAITVKRIDGGLVSGHLVRTVKPGDVLSVLGPSGHFVAEPSASARHLVLLAGGSGITPIASIVEHTLLTEAKARMTLVYGNRRRADVIFGAHLDTLAAESGGRLSIVHVLEEPSEGALTGRLDAATLEALALEGLLAPLPGEGAPEAFVCGPGPMMDAARAALLRAGLPAARIHEERFQSPGVVATARPLPTSAVPVRLRRKGAEVEVRVAPGTTVLEAALGAGVAMPFSCAMGGCAACACSVVSGQMQLDEPNCLTEAERAAGKTLTCVGRPLGPVTLEVP